MFAQQSVLHYNQIPEGRAADAFLDQRLALGRVAFPLADLVKETGLSVTAARNQLLRLKNRVTRVSPRHQFFLIVSPEHRAVGAPPVAWWLHDYLQWLGEPYYLALQSAASSLGSNPQALQVTQVMTKIPRRAVELAAFASSFCETHRGADADAAIGECLCAVAGQHARGNRF
jgi:hypothetical protein